MDIDYFVIQNQSFLEETSNNCRMMTLNPLITRPRQIENPRDCSTHKPRNIELRFMSRVSRMPSQPCAKNRQNAASVS